MSKKKRKKNQPENKNIRVKIYEKEPKQPILSKKNWKIILFSVLVLFFGFFLLLFTNSEGDNWASVVSPFIIIFGYIGIAFGIISSKEERINL